MIRVIWLNIQNIDLSSGIAAMRRKLPEHFFDSAVRYNDIKNQFFYLSARLLVAYSYQLFYRESIDWNKAVFPEQYKKPEYKGDFSFNISHSGNIIGCASALQKTEVGLDLQQVKPMSSSEYSLALNETEYQKVLLNDNSLECFYKYWTLKEAVLKLRGEGMFGDLNGFDFINFEDDDVRLVYKEKLIQTKKIFFESHEDHMGYIATDNTVPAVETQEVQFKELLN